MNKGGAERVISTLCNYGVDHGYEMHIATCLQGISQYELNEQVKKHEGFISFEEYRMKSKLETLPKLCNMYVELMHSINPDVIVSFLPEPCLITELCKRKVGKPIIGSERSNPYYQYRSLVYKTMVNRFFARSDGFVFQTEGAREFFRKGIQKKSVVIGNPVWIHTNKSVTKGERCKEIVSVGRFTLEKNYPLLLKACKLVFDRKPDYLLRIYGKEDERLHLGELAEELGISEKVFFMGQTDHVEEKICDASVFVLSSISEGMPNALMEAMALGLPVVATDCPSGGPRQLIVDGENGILVKNDDEVSLANGILKVLDNDQLAKKLSVNSRKIREDYSCEKICVQWLEYIEKVMRENS